MADQPPPGTRSLSCVDWPGFTTQLAQRSTRTLNLQADHLAAPRHLRTHAVEALLDLGVAVHEIHLDHRTTGGTTQLWLSLDSGIFATVDFLHPHHHATERARHRAVARSLHRTAAIPAHEHITVAALLPVEAAALHAGEGWPVVAGAEGTLPPLSASGQALEVSCLALVDAAEHVIVAWQAIPALPPLTPINHQPHLFALKS